MPLQVQSETFQELLSCIGPVRWFHQLPPQATHDFFFAYESTTDARLSLHLSETPLGSHVITIKSLPFSPAVIQMTLLNQLISPYMLFTDPSQAEKLSRTVYIGNMPSNEVLSIFADISRVRVTTPPDGASKFAFIEFKSAERALEYVKLREIVVPGGTLKIGHAKNPVPIERVDVAEKVVDTVTVAIVVVVAVSVAVEVVIAVSVTVVIYVVVVPVRVIILSCVIFITV